MSDILKSLHHEDTFARDILSSGPGSVIVISYEDLHLHYCNKQFEHTFVGNNTDTSSFATFLSEEQQLRLKTQLELAKKYPDTQNKYAIYSIKTAEGNYRSFYIYAAPVKSSKQSTAELYHVLLLPDLSKWPVPFISFDTRDLFLEQFNNDQFGTFEWIIPADKVCWSERLYDIFEMTDRETLLTRALLASYIHPDDTANVNEFLSNILKSSKPGNIKAKVLTQKGNIKIIQLIAEPLKAKNGRPFKLVGSVRDITEQYRIEEDLKRNVTELNRSNRELEEFAYVASHDLQEPLRKISTFSDRPSDKYQDKLEDEAKMYLERIIASADSARMLIDNLLEFSRLSRSNQPFTEVNLDFVLREVKTELELVIEETGTTINNAVLPGIEAVHSQMKQLFTNILGNSIKFRKAGVPSAIDITVSELDEAGAIKAGMPLNGIRYYKIQITDNGIGFEEEYSEKIFQIFQRLHAKSEYPGSGIGLAICKKIVDNHFGDIYAENIPGQGARFTIILPAKQYKS